MASNTKGLKFKGAFRASVITVLSMALACAGWINASAQSEKLDYPEARRVDEADTYHGVKVADPYRWMEKMDSEETRSWMKAQDQLLKNYLKGVPARAAIQKRIKELNELGDSYSPPVRAGDRYFLTKSVTGKNQPFLYHKESLDAKPHLLLDANTHFKDDKLRFSGFSPSPDGRLVAYNVTKGQSIWGWMQIMEVDSRKDKPDEVSGLRGGVAWSGDSQGFYYIRYGDFARLEEGKAKPKPEIYYHRVGTDQSEDKLVYAQPDRPEWVYGISVTEDGRYLIISIREGNNLKNRVFYKDLKATDSKIVELLNDADATYTFIGNEGSLFWFYNDLNAPRGRIIAIDINKPQRKDWTEVIPEAEEAMAGGSGVGGNAISVIGDRFVVLYRKDARPLIRIFTLQGRLEREIELPIGYVGGGFIGRKSDKEAFYSISLIFHASAAYRLDLKTGKNDPLYKRNLPFNPDDFTIRQVFYRSKDGTRVPMFVAHKKSLKMDGSSPVFMYGYGYGGWVAIPWYQPYMLAWMEMGGIYAMPNIRGGGEYGEAWNQAGIKMNRQNAIDDFIGAAEWLINNKYTSPSKMVANGGSASGAMAAAAVLQRPELFGAAIIDIPSLDMVRYHKHTIFKGWTHGFGSSENPEEFKALLAYSPYHNIRKDVCYPPILVMVGERDQGAPPLHGYKFVATMQASQKCSNPALLKIVWGAGHSFGTTPEQTQETWAEQLAFLARVLNMDASQALTKR